MNKDHLPYWLATLYLPGIGPRRILRWLEKFPSIVAFFSANADDWTAAGIDTKHFNDLRQPNWRAVERDIAWMQQAAHHHLITYDDAAYPSLLHDTIDPPLVMFVQGNAQALSQPQIAMVGARNATVNGLQNAEQFAHYLAANDLVITSGLAAGIDAAAHRGAISAKGVTIAVAGTGLQHVYPANHRALAEQIVTANGALVSEFALDATPQASHFPRRNRIISGLSVGVLVVEAAVKSGSLITVKHALEQGREVFAIPGSIHNPLARGCHALIRQGATLVETAADILAEVTPQFLCPEKSIAKKTSKAAVILKKPPLPTLRALSTEQEALLTQIGYDITPMDMIIMRSGLTSTQVSSILLALEVSGYIESVAGGYIRINVIS